jgi:hypothetical protein
MVAEEKKAAKTQFPFYLITLAALPVLQFAAGNTGRVDPLEALGIFATILIPLAALALLLRFIFKQPDLTDLMTGIIFGMVFLPMTFVQPGSNKILWMLPWLVMLLLAIKWKEPRRFLPVVLAGGSGILGFMFLYAAISSGIWQKRSAIEDVTAKAFDALPAASAPAGEKPDIYYFIFDRYQRADWLKKIYGHDNEPFLAELRKRGFFVADQSFSNYQRTAHSVVSSLNMDYLDRLEAPASDASTDWLPLYRMFQDFRLGRFLKDQGYDIHFSGSWWEPTRRIAIADQHHNHYEARELLWVIYEYSLLTDAARLLGIREGDPLYWQCQRSRLMFEELQATTKGVKPRFHFAHFLIPHPPFVTHPSGRCMEIAEVQSRSRAENYGGQISYANAEILKTVDALLALPGPKPIIVLQADEGPWPEQFAGDEVMTVSRNVSKVDWKTNTPELLREKFAILNAIYDPGLPRDDFSPDMTPVNTFRKILKRHFNVPLESLPDRMKIYVDDGHIYNFMDVTDKIKVP